MCCFQARARHGSAWAMRLCTLVSLHLSLADGAAAEPKCHAGDGSHIECKDHSYFGATVESLPLAEVLPEVMGLHAKLSAAPFPPEGTEKCLRRQRIWFGHVARYFETNFWIGENLANDMRMVFHQAEQTQGRSAEECPLAWFLALAMKIELSLESYRENIPCNNFVSPSGCLRDARGMWHTYVLNRTNKASGTWETSDTYSLLGTAEKRLADAFQQTLGPS
mmetsp:Transcript_106037/g.299969  ORF Transcript_106037/g.299969 Transcript_106037/m.299969 type:complete len:222 (-) Transcript_106037:143-808(-)